MDKQIFLSSFNQIVTVALFWGNLALVLWHHLSLQPSSVEPPAVVLPAILPALGCWCGTRYSDKDLKSRPDCDFHLQWFLVHNPEGQTQRSTFRRILGVLRACCRANMHGGSCSQSCKAFCTVLLHKLCYVLVSMFFFSISTCSAALPYGKGFFEELNLNLTEVFN